MSHFKPFYRSMKIMILAVVFLFLARSYTMAGSTGKTTLILDHENVTFRVYQVGTLADTGRQWEFTIAGDFADSGFEIGLFSKTSSQQAEKALEMQTYIKEKTITPYQSGTSGANKRIVFDNMAEGVYLFVKDDSTATNVLIDPFFATIPLRDESGTGVIYEFNSEPKSQLTTVKTDLAVTKKLLHQGTGDELPLEHQYQFKIALQKGNAQAVTIPVSTITSEVTSGLSAAVKFSGITFTQAGLYEFVITEIKPDTYHPDHTAASYDPGKIIVTVEVGLENRVLKIISAKYEKVLESGKEYHYDENNKDKTFINFLVPNQKNWQDTIILKANKKLTGRNQKPGEFLFSAALIYSSPAVTMEDVTARNTGAGEISFPERTFYAPGTYIFQITEHSGSDITVTYDGTVYYAQAEVTETLSGDLKTEVIYGTGYDKDTHQVNGTMLDIPVFENVVKGYINIRKVSYTGNRPLTGAQFKLSCRKAGSNDNWVQHGGILETTGTDGSVKLELPPLYWNYEYQLIETKAPSGYSSANVGTIVFTVSESGRIESFSSTGTAGYVTVSEDKTTLIAKNRTSSTDPGGPDPTTSPSTTEPTVPTNPTNPTESSPEPTNPTYPTIIVPPEVPLIPYTPGDPIPEGKQVVVIIDDEGVPRTYLIDDGMVPLAKTGDYGASIATLLAMMSVAFGGFVLVLYQRRTKE